MSFFDNLKACLIPHVNKIMYLYSRATIKKKLFLFVVVYEMATVAAITCMLHCLYVIIILSPIREIL